MINGVAEQQRRDDLACLHSGRAHNAPRGSRLVIAHPLNTVMSAVFEVFQRSERGRRSRTIRQAGQMRWEGRSIKKLTDQLDSNCVTVQITCRPRRNELRQMRGSAASHAHLHPSAMCCADSARGWDSPTSYTGPFYPGHSVIGHTDDITLTVTWCRIQTPPTSIGGVLC